MDTFRRGLDCDCPAGIHCTCNAWNRTKKNKKERKINRIVRTREQREIQRNIREWKEQNDTPSE